MTTSSIQNNILYGLTEGSNIGNSTYQAYALRWANRAYREIYTKAGYKIKPLTKRSIFRTSDGQQTYQAPSDFIGFVTLRDESNKINMTQIGPEEFAMQVDNKTVTDEEFTSDFGVAVELAFKAILQYSETVTTTDGVSTYARDTDYTMSYADGSITVLSTGSMSDSTAYDIDYLRWETGEPNQFCFEYDTTNKKHVFKMDPVPDDIYIASLVYPHNPSSLSGSIDPLWNLMETAIEAGGIYYGSLELIENAGLRAEFKIIYKDAVSDLIRIDQNMIPKNNTIPVMMRRTDYTDKNADNTVRSL